jgi:hypothetical protein
VFLKKRINYIIFNAEASSRTIYNKFQRVGSFSHCRSQG